MNAASDIREELLISRFVSENGCCREDARDCLRRFRWEIADATSWYMHGDNGIPIPKQRNNSHSHSQITPFFVPANTPATPPSLNDALMAFHNLQTDSMFQTPPESAHTSPEQQQQQYTPQSPLGSNQMLGWNPLMET